ncbi:hypothetical protein LZP97_26500 (plasmid) [Rhodococcus sp. DMF-1]|uniref:hypothetical protein n=1 Tax=Rhodococcus sp. DMF-1 TaxID=2907624 RepID=UPI001F2C451B|nr:hypothetical protein [Rhodococcus sp. DMF-1]UIR39646.1 hypothetical protein LZP97_26500 [Rhodococcus sp. DMF-1]
MTETSNPTEGMQEFLRLIVRRIVVGNLGTGNVERRFGQAAQKISQDRAWEPALEALNDLNHDIEEFRKQVHRRSMNKNLLSVLRRSVLQRTITPEPTGYLYLIKPRDSRWSLADEDRAAYWASTIGNSFLAEEARRPMGSSTWDGFKMALLPLASPGEWTEKIAAYAEWDIDAISEVGEEMAHAAAEVWYD